MITVIVEVNKHLFKYCILLEIDHQTHVFGYPKTCVWISNHACLCIKEHPCCNNKHCLVVASFEC